MNDFQFDFRDESKMVKSGSESDKARLKAKVDEVARASAEARNRARELAELIREIHSEGSGNQNWIASVTGLTLRQTQAAIEGKEIFHN